MSAAATAAGWLYKAGFFHRRREERAAARPRIVALPPGVTLEEAERVLDTAYPKTPKVTYRKRRV